MASNVCIVDEINSTNYSTVRPLYQPTPGYSGFVTSLVLTINLKSIASANFPPIPDGTPPDVMEQIFQELEETLVYKELLILYKKGSGTWIVKAPIRLFNKEPFYEVDLMPYFSQGNTIDVAEDLSLGIQLSLGETLATIDKIAVFGTAIEEKKNNGNEELAARIEALELALAGRLTDVPANTLLGRNATSGIVEVLPQANFTKPADLTAAISSVVAGAPSTLNTLDKLAAALADDGNFAITVANALSQKAPLNSPNFSGGASVNGNLIVSGMISTTSNLGFTNSGAAGFQAGTDSVGNVTISLLGGQQGKSCYLDFSPQPNTDFSARLISGYTELAFQTQPTVYLNLGVRVKASLPTSSTDLPPGTLWRENGVVRVV